MSRDTGTTLAGVTLARSVAGVMSIEEPDRAETWPKAVTRPSWDSTRAASASSARRWPGSGAGPSGAGPSGAGPSARSPAGASSPGLMVAAPVVPFFPDGPSMAKLYAVSSGRERAVISGLHHYALEVPDLAVAEGFLQDFGLETGEKDGIAGRPVPRAQPGAGPAGRGAREAAAPRVVHAAPRHAWTRSGRRWSGRARPSSSRRPAPRETACGSATRTAPPCSCCR